MKARPLPLDMPLGISPVLDPSPVAPARKIVKRSSLKDSTFYLDLLWAPRLYQSFVSNEKRKTFDVEHIRMGS